MSQAAVRNLLILHTPTAQALSDWENVKHRIETRAPDIEVRIANNLARNSVTRRWQGSRPSLVFSAAPLRDYQPAGGKVYAGRNGHVQHVSQCSESVGCRDRIHEIALAQRRDLVD